jgi:hypothetical protein
MPDKVKARLDKLHNGIKTHPDLHTKAFSLGARSYDCMDLIDGKPYYFRVAFDLDPVSKSVTILSSTVMQVPGPH